MLGAESRTNTTQMKVADEGTPWAGFLHGTAVLKLKNGRSRVLVPSHQRLSERVSHNALHPNLVPLGCQTVGSKRHANRMLIKHARSHTVCDTLIMLGSMLADSIYSSQYKAAMARCGERILSDAD